MAYLILTSWNTDQLAGQVNARVDDGYVPFGGLTVSSENGRAMFAQAMIKVDASSYTANPSALSGIDFLHAITGVTS